MVKSSNLTHFTKKHGNICLPFGGIVASMNVTLVCYLPSQWVFAPNPELTSGEGVER